MECLHYSLIPVSYLYKALSQKLTDGEAICLCVTHRMAKPPTYAIHWHFMGASSTWVLITVPKCDSNWWWLSSSLRKAGRPVCECLGLVLTPLQVQRVCWICSLINTHMPSNVRFPIPGICLANHTSFLLCNNLFKWSKNAKEFYSSISSPKIWLQISLRRETYLKNSACSNIYWFMILIIAGYNLLKGSSYLYFKRCLPPMVLLHRGTWHWSFSHCIHLEHVLNKLPK